MEMIPGVEDGEEDCVIEMVQSNTNTIQAFVEDLFASSADPEDQELTGVLVPSMEIRKDDAPGALREELTVVPLMEILKEAMKLVGQIDNAYTSLEKYASEFAVAFSKISPEHYATIDFMRYLLTLTDSLLDGLPRGRNSNLVVLLEHFAAESCSSTKIVTNMTVQGMEEEQLETEEEMIVSSSGSSSSANFERKRGGSFPNVSEIRVNFLAVLANKINQQVYMMRIEKSQTINELEQLKRAPIFNTTKSRNLSQKLIAEFSGPVVQAVNAKLAILFCNDARGGDEEEEQGKNDNALPSSNKEEKQEGGDGSASKRPRIDTDEHPQEEFIKISKQKQVCIVHDLPTNPFISGLITTSFRDLAKKHKLLVEEVRSNS
jgi:hypothetical protein